MGQLIAFDAVATLVLVGLAVLALRLVSGRRQAAERNVAESLVLAGHLLGAFLVIASALGGSVGGQDLAADIAWAALFGATGVVLLAVTGRLGVSLILGARLGPEIARGNVAAGLVAAGGQPVTGGDQPGRRSLAGHRRPGLVMRLRPRPRDQIGRAHV